MIVQWGMDVSWKLINFPITFKKFYRIIICDLGAENSFGFKTIYNYNVSRFYINTKNATGANFVTNCFYITIGI